MASSPPGYIKQELGNEEQNLTCENIENENGSENGDDIANKRMKFSTPDDLLSAVMSSAEQSASAIKTEENEQGLEDSMEDTDEGFFVPEHFLSQSLDQDEADDVNNVEGASAETLYTLTHTYDTGRKRVRYSCNVCEKDFKDKRECIRHIRVHTGERPFKCHICGDTFKRQDYLSRHIESHNPDRPFDCHKCDKSFAKKATLDQHILTHTDMSERPYPCSKCDSAFVKKSHLERHLKTHEAKKDFICTECGKGFLEKRRLLDHFTRKHTEKELLPCDICGRQFKWDHLLRRHKQANHSFSAQAEEDILLQETDNLPIFVSKAERENQPNT